VFIFPTPVLIRHLWQLKTVVVFLHWCLHAGNGWKWLEVTTVTKPLDKKTKVSKSKIFLKFNF